MSNDDIKKKVEKRKATEAKTNPPKKKKAKGVEIQPKFVDECLQNNEMGDGFLIAAHQKGNFIYIPESHYWAVWSGHYWKMDTKDWAAARAAVGMKVAPLYSKRAKEVRDEAQKAISAEEEKKGKFLQAKSLLHAKRAFNLKGKRCRAALEWVYAIDPEYIVPNADLDTNPYLWGFQNGVVDIRTGKLRPGHPDDKITKISPYDWPGIDAKAPELDKLLDSSLAPPPEYTGDIEDYKKRMLAYAHRYIGHSICGKTRERASVILYGEHGSNGKGTIMETLLRCLGPLGLSMEPDIFLETKAAKNPDAPTSTIMSMKGKRIINTSETNEGQKWSASLWKKFSGNDTLTGRSPHDKENTSFIPSHSLYFQTNTLPYAPSNDQAFWIRLHIIPFYWSFVSKPTEPYEKKIDADLSEKLKKEDPATCAWMVRGYHAYVKEGGLNPPPECETIKNKYKFSSDLVAQWLDECCQTKENTDPTSKELYKELYASFEAWFLTNIGKTAPSKRWFTKEVTGKGFKPNTGGTRYFYGIVLKSIRDDL